MPAAALPSSPRKCARWRSARRKPPRRSRGSSPLRPTEVDNGVKLVAETGESLARIVGKVSEINSVVADIAAGAEEQSTALQEVNTAVNQMDQATQQNAAMAEQSTAAARSMMQETEKLSEMVGQFQLGRTANTGAIRRELKKAAPHAFAPAAKPPSRPSASAAPRNPGPSAARRRSRSTLPRREGATTAGTSSSRSARPVSCSTTAAANLREAIQRSQRLMLAGRAYAIIGPKLFTSCSVCSRLPRLR